MLASVRVEEQAPVAHRSLAELDLREQWQTTVLSVKRGDEELVMPRGSLVLEPGDELIVLTDRDYADRCGGSSKPPRPKRPTRLLTDRRAGRGRGAAAHGARAQRPR